MNPPSEEPHLEVIVQNASNSKNVPSDEEIERWIMQALGAGRAGELTVRVVDEPESAALNQRFRSGKGATNVLSFPGGEPPTDAIDEVASLGDIVICAPVLEREAAEQGKSLEAHWAHVSIHGTLHLLGFDHERAEEARVMEDEERKLLAAMGYSDPYATEI